MKKNILIITLIMLTAFSMAQGSNSSIIVSEETEFVLVKIIDKLENPWALAFLPQDKGILITERPGRLNLLTETELISITGLPDISSIGQGGLLDVIIDPDFLENKQIYFSFSESGTAGYGTAVAKARLSGSELRNVEIIFRVSSKSSGGNHFGSRLLIDPEGLLYITLGERGYMPNAQNLLHHGGSVLRIYPDGRIPIDNPLIDRQDALPEIFSYGHRNPQGIAIDSKTGLIWLHEHGPKGGDEVNILKAGTNYGWPTVTYGVNYNGSAISKNTEKQGIQNPVIYWVPSIAPSGMTFYYGNKFPEWQGNIFVGALAGQHLRRLVVEGNIINHQEILLHKKIGRIRDVRTGPDGSIYLLTDAKNGALYRLSPVVNN
jgi:aldose sugar dehydrogenase